MLARLGTGASQLFVNGAGPVSSNPTSAGALTNRVRIELYPAATGSTTNMGWLVEVDQNLTGVFLPAVTGTDVLTAAGEFVPAAVVGVGVGVGGGTMMPPLLQLATTTADAKIAARPMIRTTRATGFTSEEPPIAKATER